jgi:recombination protein RecR
MTPAFEKVQKALRQLPGLGYRSAERIALYLLIERPQHLMPFVEALQSARTCIRSCTVCGNITEQNTAADLQEEGLLCSICKDPSRDSKTICIVEQVSDVWAVEKTGTFKGMYHILQGKLSPARGQNAEDLNLHGLVKRLKEHHIQEIILALSNDIEGEATCYYLQETILKGLEIRISRIGFGLPSGSGILYADSETLRNALSSRKAL